MLAAMVAWARNAVFILAPTLLGGLAVAALARRDLPPPLPVRDGRVAIGSRACAWPPREVSGFAYYAIVMRIVDADGSRRSFCFYARWMAPAGTPMPDAASEWDADAGDHRPLDPATADAFAYALIRECAARATDDDARAFARLALDALFPRLIDRLRLRLGV